MADPNNGFEERLARIAQKHGTSQPPQGPTPPEKPAGRKPKGNRGGSGVGRLMMPLVTVVMVLAGIVGFLVLSSEEHFVASMKATATAEQEGRTTIGTLLSAANDRMPDMAMGYANKKAADIIQAKEASGAFTAEQAARARASLKNREGLSSTDMVRGNMRPMILFQAQTAGQPALGEEYAAKMDRCRSVGCLSVVETEFTIALGAAQEG